MRPFEKNRWLRVAVGTVMMLCLGTLYAWSIFRAPFGALYPSWTTADLSMNFTISMVCYSAGGFLGGKLSKKTSNMVTALAAAVLILAGFLGVSWLPADPGAAKLQLYVCYGVLSGLGTGFGYNAIVSGVGGWFPDKNGLATGVLLTGFGLGTMLIGQLADALIPVVGLPALFRTFAVVMAVVLALGSPFVRLPGAGVTLPPPPATAQVEGQRDYTSGEMVRRSAFWLFFLWNMLMCASGLLVINSAANIAAYYGAAAVLGLLLSVFNGLSRIPFGVLVDKFGRRKVMLLANGFLLLSGAAAGAGRSGAQRGAGADGHAHHGHLLRQLRHHRHPGDPAVLRLGLLRHQPGHRQLLRYPRLLHRAADLQRPPDRLGGRLHHHHLRVRAGVRRGRPIGGLLGEKAVRAADM